MNKLNVILVALALASTVQAQMPNLSDGAELWRGAIDSRELRVIQIPRQATALIPLRFFLEEVPAAVARPGHTFAPDCPYCQVAGGKEVLATVTSGGLLEQFDQADFAAIQGVEALRAYAPRRDVLRQWGNQLAEVRETFRTAGIYQLTFSASERRELKVNVPFEVGPFGYLSFGQESAFFVLGCLTLGALLIFFVKWLHRRMPPNSGTLVAADPRPPGSREESKA